MFGAAVACAVRTVHLAGRADDQIGDPEKDEVSSGLAFRINHLHGSTTIATPAYAGQRPGFRWKNLKANRFAAESSSAAHRRVLEPLVARTANATRARSKNRLGAAGAIP